MAKVQDRPQDGQDTLMFQRNDSLCLILGAGMKPAGFLPARSAPAHRGQWATAPPENVPALAVVKGLHRKRVSATDKASGCHYHEMAQTCLRRRAWK